MRYLCVGDPHAKISTLQEIELLAKEVCKLIKERKPDAVVILGDLANDHERMHVQVFNAIQAFLFDISAAIYPNPLYYLIGNHDVMSNNLFLSDIHFFNNYKYLGQGFENITIVDKPICRDGAVFCPYVPNGRLKDALAYAPGWRDADVVFCHQEFKNAKYGPFLSEKGDSWSPDLALVISGHIHLNQMVQPNVYYPGTPYQTTFGEEDDKGVLLLTINQNNKDFEFVPLKIFPKVTIKTNVENLDMSVFSEGYKYRVIIEDTLENITKFKKNKNLPDGIKFIYKETDKSNVKRNVNNDDYLSLFKKSVESQHKPVKDVYEEVMTDVFKTQSC